MFFFFSLKRKMNQKEKSQPGPVAMNLHCFSNTCGYRNIANAARGEVMLR
jgi:hypothetical protein